MENVMNAGSNLAEQAGNLQVGMGSMIAAAVVCLLFCFFGLKLMKVFTTLIGFVFGAASGVAVAQHFGLENITMVIVALIGAILIAVLAFFLYRFGVFLLVLVYGFLFCYAMIQPQALLGSLICVGIAFILAILAAVFMEPIIIVLTGIFGGLLSGTIIAEIVGLDSNVWIGYGIGLVLAIIGIIVQFMLHSRKIGKKERVYAKQVKEKVSREAEVEKARMVLDDDAEEDSDNEDDDDITIIED